MPVRNRSVRAVPARATTVCPIRHTCTVPSEPYLLGPPLTRLACPAPTLHGSTIIQTHSRALIQPLGIILTVFNRSLSNNYECQPAEEHKLDLSCIGTGVSDLLWVNAEYLRFVFGHRNTWKGAGTKARGRLVGGRGCVSVV